MSERGERESRECENERERGVCPCFSNCEVHDHPVDMGVAGMEEESYPSPERARARERESA